MHREIKASALAKPFNVPVDGVRGEWPAALSGEHVLAIRELPLKLPQCPDFVATQRMHRWLTTLSPAHMQRSRPAEFNLRPFQIAYFRSPQAMPKGNQHQSGVPVPPAAILRGFNQLLDFSRCQILARPKLGSRTGTDRKSLRGVTRRSRADIGEFSRFRRRLTG